VPYGTSHHMAIGRRSILAGGLTTSLLIGGAGGYLLGQSATTTGAEAAAERPSNQAGPASRWSHEERPESMTILGSNVEGIRWTHEERPSETVELRLIPRVLREGAANAP